MRWISASAFLTAPATRPTAGVCVRLWVGVREWTYGSKLCSARLWRHRGASTVLGATGWGWREVGRVRFAGGLGALESPLLPGSRCGWGLFVVWTLSRRLCCCRGVAGSLLYDQRACECISGSRVAQQGAFYLGDAGGLPDWALDSGARCKRREVGRAVQPGVSGNGLGDGASGPVCEHVFGRVAEPLDDFRDGCDAVYHGVDHLPVAQHGLAEA